LQTGHKNKAGALSVMSALMANGFFSTGQTAATRFISTPLPSEFSRATELANTFCSCPRFTEAGVKSLKFQTEALPGDLFFGLESAIREAALRSEGDMPKWRLKARWK
jgi:hypothetical protein